MQNEPEKTVGNYNELRNQSPSIVLPRGAIELYSEGEHTAEWQEAISTALGLIDAKVTEILGENNRLKAAYLTYPQVRVIRSDPKSPDWAGYFTWNTNETTFVEDKIAPLPQHRTKVAIHEFLHYLSHNGRDDREQLHTGSPIASNNNIGFMRNRGLDIREGREGELTGDYFLAFNEAVTEQLTMDILPGVYETYHDYRGLLNQVIDDAVTVGLGSKIEDGTFVQWSRDQLKNYIYVCFFRGDLAGFTRLLQTTYQKYEISEQQFGLMTCKDDLPSLIERKFYQDKPGGPPPAPSQVAVLVQRRLNSKTSADYVTDIVGPDRGDGDSSAISYATEYDAFVTTHNLAPYSRANIGGQEYDIDTTGLVIYRGNDAATRLDYIKDVLDGLLVRLQNGEVDKPYVNEQVDRLLFETYHMSMLSDGFRDFYVYKHEQLDSR